MSKRSARALGSLRELSSARGAGGPLSPPCGVQAAAVCWRGGVVSPGTGREGCGYLVICNAEKRRGVAWRRGYRANHSLLRGGCLEGWLCWSADAGEQGAKLDVE